MLFLDVTYKIIAEIIVAVIVWIGPQNRSNIQDKANPATQL